MLTPAFSPVVAFGMPNASELMIIMVLVFIFFGAGRLPDVLKQFGKGVKEFKDASDGVERKGGKRSSPDRDGEDEDGDDDERAAFEEFKRQRTLKQIPKDTTRDVRPVKAPEPAGDDADGDGDNDDYGSAPARKR